MPGRHFQKLPLSSAALGYATFATNMIKQIVYRPALQWKPIVSHTGDRERPGHLSRITNA